MSETLTQPPVNVPEIQHNTLPTPPPAEITVQRNTPHHEVLTDGGGAIQWVDGINTQEPYSFTESLHVLSAMRELAEQVAGTKLDFKHSDEYYAHTNYRFPTFRAKTGEIDADEIARAGVAIEFAGPTTRYEDKNILPGFSPDIVTNVTDRPIGKNKKETKQIQALADVTNMPLADNSVGSVHIASLNRSPDVSIPGNETREKAIDESVRVLKDGGYLVWDGGFLSDYDQIVQNGLIPVATSFSYAIAEVAQDRYSGGEINFNGVFQKPILAPKEVKQNDISRNPNIHYSAESRTGHLQPGSIGHIVVEAAGELYASQRKHIESYENITQGIDTARIESFMDTMGLNYAPYKLIDAKNPAYRELFMDADGVEMEQRGIYNRNLDISIVARDPELERKEGSIVTEAALVHELAHSSGRERHSVITPLGEGGRTGFLSIDPATQKTYGSFLEEGFAEYVAGAYREMVSDSPNGIMGGEEKTALMAGEDGQYSFYKKYVVEDRNDDKYHITVSGIAATGIDMLVEAQPELWPILVKARSEGAEGLRNVRMALDRISPGLYAALRKLPYDTEGFAAGQREISERLQTSTKM